MLLSVLTSVYAYAASFLQPQLLAEGGDTGSKVYDFFIGR